MTELLNAIELRQHIKKLRHLFAGKGPYSQSYDFSNGHVQMWELNHKEGWKLIFMISNCVAGEDSWESLAIQRSKQSTLKESTVNIHLKDWCWSWSSSTLATWWEESTQLKRPWCWEILRVEGEWGDSRWDISMASSTQWTWVWVKSRR